MTNTEPKPKLDPNRLYLGDNGRCFCGRLEHAGQSAYFTGRETSGQLVTPLTTAEVERHHLECEVCATEHESDPDEPPHGPLCPCDDCDRSYGSRRRLGLENDE